MTSIMSAIIGDRGEQGPSGTPPIPDERIAEVAHEVNRVYCRSVGDDSQPAWADAPEWQRDSALAGVQAVRDGSVSGPEESHASWMRQKVAEGWRYGLFKDPEARTHPCIVPYSELPAAQRVKDELFLAVVRTLVRAG